MEWVQNYDPLGAPVASTLVAGLPIVLLLGLLVLGWSAPRAAGAGLLAALAVAIGLFKMPATAAAAAAGYGACFGLMPIGWIVLTAVFLFKLTVRAGQFEVVKRSVAAISPDRRIQALLIAFSFGTFLEGAAGFGTPVAISAALLIGIGFSPLYAAALALIANTSPVAFGALGTPILTLAKVTGMESPEEIMRLSQMAGRQLTPFSLLIPLWLVAVMSGWKGVKGCWPAILVCGGSFAAIQFCTSNYHGPWLVNVFGGVGSMLALTVFLRFWKPKEIWKFPEEDGAAETVADEDQPAAANATADVAAATAPSAEPSPPLTARQVAYAWTPWAILTVMIFLWGLPAWKTFLGGGNDHSGYVARIGKITIAVPYLNDVVYRAPPVAKISQYTDRADKPEPAVYRFAWLSATGTSIFLASLLAAAWLRIGPRAFCIEFAHTFYRVRWALLTIACMLALAFVTTFSGADATLGLAFTHTGVLYPFFAPLLGWLGVALTGSDTSSNALFGNLQKITAEQLGLSSTLIVASNSTGGVMGKMIDAQSIVVAAAATQQSGQEGQILRFVFVHSLILAILIGLLTLAQQYLMPWMIPQ